MDLIPALLATLALVAVAVVAGGLWRARTGRVRPSAGRGPIGPGPRVDPAATDLRRLLALAHPGAPPPSPTGSQAVAATTAHAQEPGQHATLVQLSSDLCSSCGPARRVLSRFAGVHPGVVHAEIDLTAHPHLAGELRLLTTPTTIIFDGDGNQRGRITGAPRKAELAEHLSELWETADVVTA